MTHKVDTYNRLTLIKVDTHEAVHPNNYTDSADKNWGQNTNNLHKEQKLKNEGSCKKAQSATIIT